jgi:Uma2 family endonuclease
MAKNPPHEGCIDLASDLLNTHKPSGWIVRIQEAVTLPDSEPEPDLTVVQGTRRSYLSRHPGSADIGLVVEVSDSSLAGDRADKGRIYARAGLPCYWIVNVPDRQVEVYTSPSGPTAAPGYGQRQDYHPGDAVSFILDGATIATLPVQELLP